MSNTITGADREQRIHDLHAEARGMRFHAERLEDDARRYREIAKRIFSDAKRRDAEADQLFDEWHSA